MTQLMKQLLETELVVCSAELKQDHPELFHYTKRGGFEGILANDTLRASHFGDMNDKREVWLLRERLIQALAPRFEALAEGLNLHRRVMFNKGGRGRGGATRMLDALYNATFGSSRGPTKLQAFMTSFSTHASDGELELKNGLWSQWEQYAGLDGYCTVFDTAALVDLLCAEFDAGYWVRLALGSVRYSAPDVPLDELMPELVLAGEDVFRQFLEGADLQEFAVPQFLMGSTLLKDAGWCEEREIRIVAIPGTEKLTRLGLKTYPGRFKRLPMAEVEKRDDGLRFLMLFGERKVRLPVKRIIVGPAAGAEERIALARRLRPDVPAMISTCAPPMAASIADIT